MGKCGKPVGRCGKRKRIGKIMENYETISEWSFTVYLRAYSFLRQNKWWKIVAEAQVSSQQ